MRKGQKSRWEHLFCGRPSRFWHLQRIVAVLHFHHVDLGAVHFQMFYDYLVRDRSSFWQPSSGPGAQGCSSTDWTRTSLSQTLHPAFPPTVHRGLEQPWSKTWGLDHSLFRSLIRSFACTIHSFPHSAVQCCTACFARAPLFACSLAHSLPSSWESGINVNVWNQIFLNHTAVLHRPHLQNRNGNRV